eukprot:g2806.t1
MTLAFILMVLFVSVSMASLEPCKQASGVSLGNYTAGCCKSMLTQANSSKFKKGLTSLNRFVNQTCAGPVDCRATFMQNLLLNNTNGGSMTCDCSVRWNTSKVKEADKGLSDFSNTCQQYGVGTGLCKWSQTISLGKSKLLLSGYTCRGHGCGLEDEISMVFSTCADMRAINPDAKCTYDIKCHSFAPYLQTFFIVAAVAIVIGIASMGILFMLGCLSPHGKTTKNLSNDNQLAINRA